MKNQRSVLVVEDEEIIRTTLREYLLGEGYLVDVAGTVSEALALARDHDFEVAICDVQLPDGDGINMARRLQQLNLETSVLVITAYATVENAVDIFSESGLPIAVVNDLEQAAKSPQVADRDMLQELHYADGQRVPVTGPAVKLSRGVLKLKRAAPARPGEHTDEVFREWNIG